SFTRYYVINNTGSSVLNIGTISLSNNRYSVTLAPATSVVAGGNTQLGIRYNPIATGTSNCVVTIPNNDANENPYTFALTGVGVTSGGINAINDKQDLLDAPTEKATSVEIYPNPANASFEVSVPSESAIISIISLDGRLLKKVTTTSKTTTIDSSNWVAGTYLVQVQTGTQITVKKAVIVK
ncbi:MAG: T9SS C-terminal target domain-containing protein, partial [Sphingobacteriales bacterium]